MKMVKGLEHMSCLMAGSEENRARVISVVPRDGSKREEAQNEIQEIPIKHKKKFFTVQTLEWVDWGGCRITILGDIQKPTARGNVQCAVANPVLSREDGLGDSQRPFKLSDSVILC